MSNNHEQEFQMRDSEALHPKTIKELARYIKGLEDMEHNYGTCVYAVSLASTATFNYMAHKLGITGFQAGCADLDILKRTRHMEDGFVVLNGSDVLYPQYDLVSKAQKFVSEQRIELKDKARQLLAGNPNANQEVIKHWKELANEGNDTR